MEAHVILHVYCKSVGVLMIIAILSKAFGMPCPLQMYYDCIEKKCVNCSEICENAELNGTQDKCARHRNCYIIWHSDIPPNKKVDTTTKSHNASMWNEIFDIPFVYPFYSTTAKQTTSTEPTTIWGQTVADDTKTVQTPPSESTASISLLEVVWRRTIDVFVILAGICLFCVCGYCINKCCCKRRIKSNSSIV